MGKTRHLFKKIGNSKGTFQTKMGTIKHKNGKDLTEAKEIEKVARIPKRSVPQSS